MTRTKMSIFIFLFLLPVAVLSLSCQGSQADKDIEYYTCPMHPQIRMDAPGQCPICGMTLIPVKKEKSKDVTTGSESDAGGAKEQVLHIDPSYVQNIGMVTESVEKRVLVYEIPTYGKVAHDHKLWVAQNEYIESLKLGDASLIKSSELKLKYMGLSDKWIQAIKKTRSADITLHIESEGEPTFFEAYVYQEDIGRVQEGLETEITDQKGRFLANGHVKAIGTLVDLNSRSVRVLVESEKPLDLKLNTFIQVKIKIPMGEKLSVSKEAILFNGNHNMVYLSKGDGAFEPRVIQVGEEADGYYEVLGGLTEGELVVTNGHFLIDSESQIKMGGMQGHSHD